MLAKPLIHKNKEIQIFLYEYCYSFLYFLYLCSRHPKTITCQLEVSVIKYELGALLNSMNRNMEQHISQEVRRFIISEKVKKRNSNVPSLVRIRLSTRKVRCFQKVSIISLGRQRTVPNE